MTWLDVLLLGIMEGLTEFLPVSSTGHLILLGERLGQHDEAAKALEIVIQLGAVLAVVVYYRRRLAKLLRGLLQRDPAAVRLTLAVVIAFVPAAIVGLALHKAIKHALFHTGPVAWALIIGGVAMFVSDRIVKARAAKAPAEEANGADELEQVTPKRALAIGLAQCLSLWPGASRSMTSIVGGQLSGLSTAASAEFSFLLAIPTLGAATVFSLVKSRHELLDAPGSGSLLLFGLAVAFAVALLVIAAFLRYLKRFGLVPFGAYRILLGAIVLTLAAKGLLTDPGAKAASADPAASAAPAKSAEATAR
jgi:undecaprenyl-diphosphatase